MKSPSSLDNSCFHSVRVLPFWWGQRTGIAGSCCLSLSPRITQIWTFKHIYSHWWFFLASCPACSYLLASFFFFFKAVPFLSTLQAKASHFPWILLFFHLSQSPQKCMCKAPPLCSSWLLQNSNTFFKKNILLWPEICSQRVKAGTGSSPGIASLFL